MKGTERKSMKIKEKVRTLKGHERNRKKLKEKWWNDLAVRRPKYSLNG